MLHSNLGCVKFLEVTDKSVYTVYNNWKGVRTLADVKAARRLNKGEGRKEESPSAQNANDNTKADLLQIKPVVVDDKDDDLSKGLLHASSHETNSKTKKKGSRGDMGSTVVTEDSIMAYDILGLNDKDDRVDFSSTDIFTLG